jgi:hypothetical protein
VRALVVQERDLLYNRTPGLARMDEGWWGDTPLVGRW